MTDAIPKASEKSPFFYVTLQECYQWYGHLVSYTKETHPDEMFVFSVAKRVFSAAAVVLFYIPYFVATWVAPITATQVELPSSQPPVESTPLPSQEDAEAVALNALNSKLDALLKEITEAKITALRNELETSPHKEHSDVIEIRKIVDFLEPIVKTKSLGRLWQYLYNEQLNTIPVPSDGNCLFHAFAALLTLLGHPNILAHEQLRAQVSTFINKKYQEAEDQNIKEQEPDCENPGILDHLRASMEAYQAVRTTDLRSELDSLTAQEAMGEDKTAIAAARTRIENELRTFTTFSRADYVRLSFQDKFHGGPAEIYGLSQLFQVHIEIERLYVTYRNGQIAHQRKIAGFDRPYGVGFERTVTLVNVGGDHYDAALPT